ncbi:hypothetical protein J4E86_009973 [Alternaria arbusti]|uniref:uncharacterized protein n=1 Tax=Alternaria arbusti TaxID=232088 RepID=UPI00222085D0|nr:uncharacterized protein J4E86_009973 [Alternaria arbusti]KAI4943026.1 hypothetical protein J4E86_009973 [Alternaria arbusti]
MPATTSSMLSTLLLAIPLLFPSAATAAAVVKKDVSSAVVVASEAALVDAAVTFTLFSSDAQCRANQGTRSCDGREKQVYAGNVCVDIASFRTIKAFCG